MAKNVKNEKVYLASVNWGSLLFGIILTVLACYGYSFLIGDVTVGALSLNTFDAELILAYFEAEQFFIIPQMIFLVIFSVFQLIALINVIRLVIGTFGFLGKKDSRKMAMKLAKHAKIAFAVMGTAIAIPTIAAMDNGVLPEGLSTYYVVVGVAAGLCFLAVRYYRWFVVEKKPVLDWVFPLVRDLAFFAIPAVLFVMLLGNTVTPLGSMLHAFEMLMAGGSSTLIQNMYIADLLNGFVDVILLFMCFGTIKAALKFLPFDNYKKTAAKKISGKILATLIWMIIFVACIAVVTTTLEYGEFNTEALIAEILVNKDVLIQLLLFTVGSMVLGGVAQRHDYDNVQLASVKVAAPAAPQEETAETEATEEVAEEE